LLLCVFNLASNPKLDGLAQQVYLAQEARYKSTGKFVAFSEGNTGLDNTPYVYEWVVDDGSTWTINDGQKNVGIAPIIYFKAAVGLLAMYNTPFTENMTSNVEAKLPSPTSGYSPESWFVLAFIVGIIFVGCARLVVVINGFRRKNSAKPVF
jgi:hypothetical protein